MRWRRGRGATSSSGDVTADYDATTELMALTPETLQPEVQQGLESEPPEEPLSALQLLQLPDGLLDDDARLRLLNLESWRRQNELPYRCGARKQRNRASAAVSSVMETTTQSPQLDAELNDEMLFIWKHFNEPPCAKFQLMKHHTDYNPPVCAVCGLTQEFHEDDNTGPAAAAAATAATGEDFPDLGRQFLPKSAASSAMAVGCDVLDAVMMRNHPSCRPDHSGDDHRDHVHHEHHRSADYESPNSGPESFIPRRKSFNGLLDFVQAQRLQAVAAGGTAGSTRSSRCGSRAKSVPALTFGSIFIPQRFLRTEAGQTGRGQICRKYLRFDPKTASMKYVWELLTKRYQLHRPSLVLSVTGGAMAKMNSKMRKCLSGVISKLVYDTEAWIISGGRNYGSSRFLGRLLVEGSEDASVKDDNGEQRRGDPVLIGVSHWGSIRRKKLLYGISLPSHDQGSRYFYSMEFQLSREELPTALNPFQSAYLLLDNGKTEPENCVKDFRFKLDAYLKQETGSKTYARDDMSLPVVTLVLGGDGMNTIDQVYDAVSNDRPVVVVKGSSRIPTLLAELFYALEDKVPRAWNCNISGWDLKEDRTFQTYVNRFTNDIHDIFHISVNNATDSKQYQSILEILRKIMEKRYFMAIVDCELETGQDLYSSILRGIYKGYNRRCGLAIALKTCCHDFLEALFHRQEENRDGPKHFITLSSLNNLHMQNLGREVSMTSILKMVCKRESYAMQADDRPNILPVIGRILHLLMGPRFRILYHDEQFLKMREDAMFTSKRTQVWHLLLWSVLSNKPAMSHFFVLQSAAPLGAALVAFMLYSRLAEWASESFEEELRCSLDKAADHFQQLAIHMLDRMYEKDPEDAYRVLICELPFNLGPYVTPLVIADDAKAMDFMSQGCCQTFLQRVWKGNMAVDTPFWKSFPLFILVPFVVIPWIHFYDSSLTPSSTAALCTSSCASGTTIVCCTCKKCSPNEKGWRRTVAHLVDYVTAPVTKFYSGMLSYLCFLFLVSYFVLTDLRPFTSASNITASEWILIVWIISHFIEELVQVFGQHDTGPLDDLPNSALPSNVWHRTEIFRLHISPIHSYLRGGRWNSIDMTIVALFVTSFSLRFALPPNAFQIVRVAFAITVIFCYFRLLRFWFVLSSIGPRIIAIQMMLTELLKFLLILAVFVVSFGIAFQAILHPNQTPSGTTLVDILWRPYWQMFGELYLEDESGGMGRDVSDSSCVADMMELLQLDDSVEKLHAHNGTDMIYCMEWAAPVLLGVYLLIANVLLLNLLIAIFSQAYEDVKGVSHTVFLYNLYSLIQECYYQTAFPPPLSLIERSIQAVRNVIKLCRRCDQLPDEYIEDNFRLKQSAVGDEVQKRACENAKPYNVT